MARGFAVLALAAASLGLHGCGGDQTTPTPGPTPAPTPTPKPAPSPPSPAPPTPPPPPSPPNSTACLCIFDIDRTLTGKQGSESACPADKIQPGVRDDAYFGGTLLLSALAVSLNSSACAKCYIGTVSAGTASGPKSKERAVLHEKLSVVPGMLPTSEWSGPDVTSPLVTAYPDKLKQNAVPGILAWYKRKGVDVSPSDVHFFDDRADNVLAFKGHPYNARQISCAARDLGGKLGLCGATPEEVVLEKGIKTCSGGSDVMVV